LCERGIEGDAAILRANDSACAVSIVAHAFRQARFEINSRGRIEIVDIDGGWEDLIGARDWTRCNRLLNATGEWLRLTDAFGRAIFTLR